MEHSRIPSNQVHIKAVLTLSKILSMTSDTMPVYSGSCFCRSIQYNLTLSSPDEARTSLCHCRNCKVGHSFYSYNSYNRLLQKAFGTNYGLTAKVPKDSFQVTAGAPKEHVSDNGSGVQIHREFCVNCGSFILEYGVSYSRHHLPLDIANC